MLVGIEISSANRMRCAQGYNASIACSQNLQVCVVPKEHARQEGEVVLVQVPVGGQHAEQQKARRTRVGVETLGIVRGVNKPNGLSCMQQKADNTTTGCAIMLYSSRPHVGINRSAVACCSILLNLFTSTIFLFLFKLFFRNL